MAVPDHTPKALIPEIPSEKTPSKDSPSSSSNKSVTRVFLAQRDSVSLVILSTLAVLYTLYAARAILLPIVMALLIALTLRPVIRYTRRYQLPDALSAGLTLFIIFLISLLSLGNLMGPANEWIQAMPAHMREAMEKVRPLAEGMSKISETSQRIDDMAENSDNEEAPVAVEIKQSTLSTNLAIVSSTGNYIGSVLLVFVLSFFMLSAGDALLNSILKIMPTLSDKKRIVGLVYDVEEGIASYLLTITVINALLGVAVAVCMGLLGLPNPFLWGVMAFVMNYVPFIGAIAGTGILLIMSILHYDALAYAMIPPAMFVLLTGLEGNFITPAVLGRSMSLNPILVLISLVFWGWIWGLGGAIIAVPMLAVLKIACEQFEKTKPLAILLGGHPVDSPDPDENPDPEAITAI